MEQDGVSLLILQEKPALAASLSSQLLLHASFSISNRNLIENSADSFCFRSRKPVGFACLNIALAWAGCCVSLAQRCQCSWAGGRTDAPRSPLPVPIGLWTLLFIMMSGMLKAITQVELQKSEGGYLSGKIDIIICNRLSNCVRNHFLLRTLVHLRRETSWFLCKECHHDLLLMNHPVPNLHFPVFSTPVASLALEKQPESSSDFFGSFE